MKKFLLSSLAVLSLLQLQPAPANAADKKILFLAGPRDHGGGGRHEYELDLRTLAESFDKATNLGGVRTEVLVGSLPRDLTPVLNASVIVINSSSDRSDKETHPLFPPNPTTNGRGYDDETTAYLKSLDGLIKQHGIGIVIIHYASWAENWTARDYYLKWTGGLWVQIASKNPVDDWSMTLLDKTHPILRGVSPWEYRDEIFSRYFLPPNDKRRTDLILATPQQDKQGIGPQVAAWAYQRDDGGRGFVFGGLDFRDNLAKDNYRKFLMNGIAWAGRIEIPKEGIVSPTPDVSNVSPRSFPAGAPPATQKADKPD